MTRPDVNTPWEYLTQVGGPACAGCLAIGHGLVHALFAVPTPAATGGAPEWPFAMARSWAITGAGLDLHVIRAVGLALMSIVIIGFALAALSTVGVLVPPAWWQATIAVSAIGSAVMLVLFFEPQLVLGLGLDAVLVTIVATRAWVP